MEYNKQIVINNRTIDICSPTYFVADIAANHNGDIETAKELIHSAKEAGADAVKFQHFLADKIVSDYGFQSLGNQLSHQASWEKSVYETYKEAEFDRKWNEVLASEAKRAKIDFFTSPYDYEALDDLDSLVPAYKIGSGDITWIKFIEQVAKRKKPVMIATGASNMNDVERAIDAILRFNPNIILMQCNTNYTAERENFRFINLNVLRTYSIRYPGMVLGLSDHTLGHTTVLGAIALGARVIEKHFTLDNNQSGPDHAFSMNPVTWRDMVNSARELEYALGTGVKIVEENEHETVVLQRRCIYVTKKVMKGEIISENNTFPLRPVIEDAVLPYEIDKVIGKKFNKDIMEDTCLRWEDIDID